MRREKVNAKTMSGWKTLLFLISSRTVLNAAISSSFALFLHLLQQELGFIVKLFCLPPLDDGTDGNAVRDGTHGNTANDGSPSGCLLVHLCLMSSFLLNVSRRRSVDLTSSSTGGGSSSTSGSDPLLSLLLLFLNERLVDVV